MRWIRPCGRRITAFASSVWSEQVPDRPASKTAPRRRPCTGKQHLHPLRTRHAPSRARVLLSKACPLMVDLFDSSLYTPRNRPPTFRQGRAAHHHLVITRIRSHRSRGPNLRKILRPTCPWGQWWLPSLVHTWSEPCWTGNRHGSHAPSALRARKHLAACTLDLRSNTSKQRQPPDRSGHHRIGRMERVCEERIPGAAHRARVSTMTACLPE